MEILWEAGSTFMFEVCQENWVSEVYVCGGLRRWVSIILRFLIDCIQRSMYFFVILLTPDLDNKPIISVFPAHDTHRFELHDIARECAGLIAEDEVDDP